MRFNNRVQPFIREMQKLWKTAELVEVKMQKRWISAELVTVNSEIKNK